MTLRIAARRNEREPASVCAGDFLAKKMTSVCGDFGRTRVRWAGEDLMAAARAGSANDAATPWPRCAPRLGASSKKRGEPRRGRKHAAEGSTIELSAMDHERRTKLRNASRCLPLKPKGLASVSTKPFGLIGGANRDRTGDLYNAIVELTNFRHFSSPCFCMNTFDKSVS